MGYEVEVRTLTGRSTAVGAGGPFTLVVDRPESAGGGGLGFSGGQLLNMAVAGCVSNDLFREAAKRGVAVDRVVVRASSDYAGDPAIATDITYEVELFAAGSTDDALRELAQYVDQIAEIPIRFGAAPRCG